jgi:beta-glucosidase/6-phospho-beta-glucosidase/beta-galactosidase
MSVEPYIVGYNLLNAHAAAGNLYLTKYAPTQGGHITMVVDSEWNAPLNPASQDDVAAAQRALDFGLGWFADPLYFGDWPASMKASVGSRLPAFSASQSYLLTHSHDYFGLNHYTSRYTTTTPPSPPPPSPDFYTDMDALETPYDLDGNLIGPQADSTWLYVVPWGIHDLLVYVYNRYGAPILITENGCDVPGESQMPVDRARLDTFRVNYLQDYLSNVSLAIDDGADVFGYFVWSLLDNFEWADGYSKRFGITYVDYSDNEKRDVKLSAAWYSSLTRG